jgi:hypothetical protein
MTLSAVDLSSIGLPFGKFIPPQGGPVVVGPNGPVPVGGNAAPGLEIYDFAKRVWTKATLKKNAFSIDVKPGRFVSADNELFVRITSDFAQPLSPGSLAVNVVLA